jgi:hypothetical protein
MPDSAPTEGAPAVVEKKSRKSYLTTYDLARLDNACKVLESAWHWRTYLVGTAEGGEYRDVDVRTILDDTEFDQLFEGRQQLWELVCLAITAYLRDATGLPIDYQIQRTTEANEKFGDKPRNPLGTREGNRFAGGGDATHFERTPRPRCDACGCVKLWDDHVCGPSVAEIKAGQ